MNVFYLGIGFMVLLFVVFLSIDFTKFIAAKNKEDQENELKGIKCDAGGVMFVQGKRTYYQMPNGERRKIADFPMDLTPGSKDLNEFTRIMDRAATEKIKEDRQKRMKAKENMIDVAKEVLRGTK